MDLRGIPNQMQWGSSFCISACCPTTVELVLFLKNLVRKTLSDLSNSGGTGGWGRAAKRGLRLDQLPDLKPNDTDSPE